MSERISRREFLKLIGGVTASSLIIGGLSSCNNETSIETPPSVDVELPKELTGRTVLIEEIDVRVHNGEAVTAKGSSYGGFITETVDLENSEGNFGRAAVIVAPKKIDAWRDGELQPLSFNGIVATDYYAEDSVYSWVLIVPEVDLIASGIDLPESSILPEGDLPDFNNDLLHVLPVGSSKANSSYSTTGFVGEQTFWQPGRRRIVFDQDSHGLSDSLLGTPVVRQRSNGAITLAGINEGQHPNGGILVASVGGNNGDNRYNNIRDSAVRNFIYNLANSDQK